MDARGAKPALARVAVPLSRAALLLTLPLIFTACEAHPGPGVDASARPRDVTFATVIHRPPSLESIAVERGDAGLVRVPCANCHDLFRGAPPTLPSRAEEVGGPHAGLRFAHGALACRSCHEPSRYDGLRLATGEVLPMTEAIQLCRQCHGPQARDYDHGSHGGMRGHWDLSRGPRERNHCVDCHDPHSPAWGQFLPAPPPRDTLPGAHP